MTSAIHPQDEAELYGDGYSNEYQRALAVSQMTTPRKNAVPEAQRLAASGKFVVVVFYPVYCRITDAILGDASRIVSVADDYETAVGMTMNQLDPDDRAQVFCPLGMNPNEQPGFNPDTGTVSEPTPESADEILF